MNRVPFVQPNLYATNGTSHWWDENQDRRIVSPDGKTAVVFLCKKHHKQPRQFRPMLIDIDTNRSIMRVTVSKGLYYFSTGWGNDVPCLQTRIKNVPIEPDDVLAERLFKVHEGIRI
jgi:hypothetical protein